nr:hypothetical protein [Tanacetum cinerariifolium]
MGVTRETRVSSPTDLSILVFSSPGVPLRATPTRSALRVDADTQENTMADVNVNALAGQVPIMAPPMHTDDQILPYIRWVPIGKRNCYLDVEKSCQLVDQWFDLTKDTLRDALQITPVNNNQAFTSPPSSDALINFVNELGYPKPGLESKKRKPLSSLRYEDESVAEDVPAKEPQVDDEEADVQRALEESLKSMYDVPRGPLPPVVIREPESGKYQPLLEVPRKGKEKVIEEQVARDLLNLQTSKKKSPADRYILQRRTSTPTGSFGHDESSSIYAELGLTDNEEEFE